MFRRTQIPAWIFAAAIACGGWTSACAAALVPGQRDPDSQAAPADDSSRPFSRITGVQSLTAPSRPERYQRSAELVGAVRTAAVQGDDGAQTSVVTADAVREIPGDGPQPAAIPRVPLPAPRPAANQVDVVESDWFGVRIAVGLVCVAMLLGLWLRIRQSRVLPSDAPGAAADPENVAISFERPAARAANQFEALIRNELALIEEPVQIPPRLEFYGWPDGIPVARVDAAHLDADSDLTQPRLAGPHFLRRPRAPAAAAEGSGDQPLRRPGRRRAPAIAGSARIPIVHAAHGTDRPPRSRRQDSEEPISPPGLLERALERLAKNQS